MKEATQQYSDITYNTFADVIDWDDLTEKELPDYTGTKGEWNNHNS